VIKLIGVSGKICSGKTTISEALIEKYGYQRVVLAEPIKQIAKWYIDNSKGLLLDEDVLTYMLYNILTREGDFTRTVIEKASLAKGLLLHDIFPQFRKADWSVEKNNDIRLLYQMIGERMRKTFGDDVWVRAMIQRIKQAQKHGTELFICDDVRQKSEYAMMKDFGFEIVRLTITPEEQARRIKELYGYIEPERLKHISETDLDNVTDFDLTVDSSISKEQTLEEIINYIDRRSL
jgi:hypothetical protein